MVLTGESVELYQIWPGDRSNIGTLFDISDQLRFTRDLPSCKN